MGKVPPEISTELNDLLELISQCVAADGVLISRASGDEDPTAVAATPAGLGERCFPLSRALRAICGKGVQSTSELLLPLVLTAWLGMRPGFVALHKLKFSESEGYLFFWWKDRPAEGELLYRRMAQAMSLVQESTERKATRMMLEQMQDRLDAMLQNVSLGIVFVDFMRGSLVNPVAARLLDLEPGRADTSTVVTAMQLARWASVVEKADDAVPGALTDVSVLNQAGTAEYWIRSDRQLVWRVESHSVGSAASPGRFWVFTDVRPLWESAERVKTANQGLQHNLSMLADEVGRRTEAEAALRQYSLGLKQQNEQLEVARLQSDLLANQDALTGLANHRRFHRGLEIMLKDARQSNGRVAVLYLDLDKFKQVNDTLGHDRGDILLKAVASTLVKVLRTTDLIARIGGDEFACALPIKQMQKDEAIRSLVAQLSRRLNMPIEGAGEPILVSATIGLAVFPEDAEDAGSLLQAADRAMYLGKRKGGNEVTLFSRTIAPFLKKASH